MRGTPPLGVRLYARLVPRMDWAAITSEGFVEFREATNRRLSSPVARLVIGKADRGAIITDRTLDVGGRELSVRVYRPSRDAASGRAAPLPLVVQFHGGGFVVGTAAQCDWNNSHLAAHLPAVVVSVDYRLAPEHPLPEPVDDGFDAVTRLVEDAAAWGIDPDRVAVLGESAGGTIASLVALRARETDLALRAQLMVCAPFDWTSTMLDYPSMADNADNPTVPPELLEAYRRTALPASVDPASVSPLMYEDLAGLPPALIITGNLDPLEDQGAAYAERLRDAGVETRHSSYPRAIHAFVSMPGLVPAAKDARAEILEFLRERLSSPETPSAPMNLRSVGAKTETR